MSIPSTETRPQACAPGAADREWILLREAARRARGLEPSDAHEFSISASGQPEPADTGAATSLTWHDGRWTVPDGSSFTALVDLYLPVCSASRLRPLTVGHLGQSLDGYVATASGDSDFVTGPENIVHLHRMRALADAVIVGAGTAASDDPQLTVRRAEGENPVRVVLDPRRRLPESLRVFQDGRSTTLLVAERGAPGGSRHGKAEVLGIPALGAGESADGPPAGRSRLDLRALVAELHARGLFLLFVEGGGETVSGFLEAGLLDRLQVAVAPLLTGRGRPALRLPPRETIADCLRPSHRVFAMGEDLLFDCDFRSADRAGGPGAEPALSSIPAGALRRIT